MLGDATLFIRGDETEAAWGALTPVLERWGDGGAPADIPSYEAGTWGPPEADRILEQPGRVWRRL